MPNQCQGALGDAAKPLQNKPNPQSLSMLGVNMDRALSFPGNPHFPGENMTKSDLIGPSLA